MDKSLDVFLCEVLSFYHSDKKVSYADIVDILKKFVVEYEECLQLEEYLDSEEEEQ